MIQRYFQIWGPVVSCVRARVCMRMRSATQLWLTLYDPMDCNPPGSSVHGILHARILEWVAISSSRGCFQHLHWQVESITIEPPRKPLSSIYICRCFPFLNCLLPFTVIALIIIVAVIACIYWILTVCKYFSKYLMCIVTHVVLKIILWGRYYCVWICVC